MKLRFVRAAIAPVLAAGLYILACGSSSSSPSPNGAGSSSSGSMNNCGILGCSDSGEQGPSACVNLECQRPFCPSTKLTTVTGKVFDPAGSVPLYNVTVYIPNSDPKPITHGATCDKCASTVVNPVGAAALTNEKGEFTIENAPAGKDIPLVLEVGKWRRQITIDVKPCEKNEFVDPQKMRLPRNKSEGELPKMAITTGGCDPFGCLFRRVGIDASEFTSPSQNGSVHVYRGTGGGDVAGGGAPDAQSLWNDLNVLKKYDAVLLSCECDEHNETKSSAAMKAMKDYLDLGGRVFATHYHYTWFKNGPADLPSIAEWGSTGGGSGAATIDQSFPKGQALAGWLSNVGASTTKGSLNVSGVAGDVGGVKAAGQRWVSLEPDTANEAVVYFTFNTPVSSKSDAHCGRGIMSDLHVSNGAGTDWNLPTACASTPLSPQERALEFMFFDLSACVQSDAIAPTPPK